MAEKKNTTDVSGYVKAGLWIVGGYYGIKVLKSVYNYFNVDVTGDGKGTAHENKDCGKFKNMSYKLWQYDGWADEIEAAIWQTFFDLTEDDSRISEVLMYMKTDDDVAQLICAYGVRGAGIIVQDYYNLTQSISGYLDPDYIEVVNEYYESVGITYRW